MSRFVLDNTVTMAWCFADEATEFTETLLTRLSNLSDSAIVPALWLYEVVNVTELAVRKGRITDEKASAFLESLADLPIEIENPTRPQMFPNKTGKRERSAASRTSGEAIVVRISAHQSDRED